MFGYRVYSALLISALLVACAQSPSKRPLAPVYKGYTNPYQKSETVAQSTPQQPAQTITPKPQPVESAKTKTDQRPAQTLASVDRNLFKPAPLLPAVSALVNDADKKSRVGNLEGAVFSLERALRIDSRSALVTYKLAQLRAKQNKLDLAENLSKQAALLAGNDVHIKKLCWTLIAEVRDGRNDIAGARAARLKAADFD